MGDMFVLYGIH